MSRSGLPSKNLTSSPAARRAPRRWRGSAHLEHFLLLMALLAALTWAWLVVYHATVDEGAADGRGMDIKFFEKDLDPSEGVGLWSLIALSGTVGVTLSHLFSTAYHGFLLRQFDPGVRGFQWMMTVHAAFITLAFFALLDFLMPESFGLDAVVPAINVATFGLALLAGYFNDQVFQSLHQLFTRLLRQPVKQRLGTSYNAIVGIDHPIGPLLDQLQTTCKAALKKSMSTADVEREIDRLKQALSKSQLEYSHKLIAVMGSAKDQPRRIAAFAKKHGVHEECLAHLVRFANVSRGLTDLDGLQDSKIVPDHVESAEDLYQHVLSQSTSEVKSMGKAAVDRLDSIKKYWESI